MEFDMHSPERTKLHYDVRSALALWLEDALERGRGRCRNSIRPCCQISSVLQTSD